jgi:hypothetical protein
MPQTCSHFTEIVSEKAVAEIRWQAFSSAGRGTDVSGNLSGILAREGRNWKLDRIVAKLPPIGIVGNESLVSGMNEVGQTGPDFDHDEVALVPTASPTLSKLKIVFAACHAWTTVLLSKNMKIYVFRPDWGGKEGRELKSPVSIVFVASHNHESTPSQGDSQNRISRRERESEKHLSPISTTSSAHRKVLARQSKHFDAWSKKAPKEKIVDFEIPLNVSDRFGLLIDLLYHDEDAFEAAKRQVGSQGLLELHVDVYLMSVFYGAEFALEVVTGSARSNYYFEEEDIKSYCEDKWLAWLEVEQLRDMVKNKTFEKDLINALIASPVRVLDIPDFGRFLWECRGIQDWKKGNFPPGDAVMPFIHDRGLNHFAILPWYDTFYEMLVNGEDNRFGRRAILGASGIGKSTCGWYFMCRLVCEGRKTFQGHNFIFYCTGGRKVSTSVYMIKLNGEVVRSTEEEWVRGLGAFFITDGFMPQKGTSALAIVSPSGHVNNKHFPMYELYAPPLGPGDIDLLRGLSRRHPFDKDDQSIALNKEKGTVQQRV